MKKMLLSVSLLALSGLSLAAPSSRAPSLQVLNLGEALCYEANVEVDKKADLAKERAAETQMGAALKGLGVRATEYDAAEVCDRVLVFDLKMNNVGAPMIYKSSLSLESLVATDSGVDVGLATVWEILYWGGNRGEVSAAEISRIFNEKLTDGLQQFKDDYRSLRTAGQGT